MRAQTISTKAQTAQAVEQTISFSEQLLQLLLLTVLATAGYFFISRYVLQAVKVEGVSMMPTLHNADQYYLKRWVYFVRTPKRGDIVVIKDPTDGSFAVKRIIALSGESVFINKDGGVYVNGSRLDETYLKPGTTTATCAKAPEEMINCGEGKYFVLGDNRANSFDSRYYGPIPRENILGVITP